ncbi:MAG: hypothetical protein J6Y37_09795 [Paludibacteraceae bacterium]|nr:hypothetical protein [Paludibacteraceae bacterium]
MKLKGIISLMSLLALATSCTEEYVTREYITQEIGSQVYTYVYDVLPKDWRIENATDGRNYLYAEFENMDLTTRIAEKGVVMASVLYTYNQDKGLQSWNNLPYVFPFTTKDGEVIGENIRFEYEPQRVTFVIEDLDGKDPEEVLNTMTFKVSLIDKK